MAGATSEHLVTTDWLADHLAAPDVIVVDASWHLPTAGRDGKAEYLEEHIPGALYFDIDDLSDTDRPAAPHAAEPGEVRVAHAPDGHRRRQACCRL